VLLARQDDGHAIVVLDRDQQCANEDSRLCRLALDELELAVDHELEPAAPRRHDA
jgi:hypothetical protein